MSGVNMHRRDIHRPLTSLLTQPSTEYYNHTILPY